MVCNVSAEICEIEKIDNKEVNAFNKLVMDIFNVVSGNMLKENNILWYVYILLCTSSILIYVRCNYLV